MKHIGFPNFPICATKAIIFLVLTVGLMNSVHCADAQSSSSGLNGVVTDSSGAVVQGAKITIRNVDTNVDHETTSNSSGDYFFTSLPPARYTVAVTAPQFQTETISTFEVGVAQVVTINVVLRVGSVSQTVTVGGGNTEVESSTSQLGVVIDEKATNDLPLDGRNFTQLLDLTPGVSPVDNAKSGPGTDTAMIGGSGITNFSFPSINGGGNRSTIYLVDGMNNNSAWFNTYAVPPIIDTVSEFTINSHTDSQYGGVMGGVVNVATKAGTNIYHGSGWEYLRTNSFDASPYFSAPPSYHLNIFGAQAGGPIRIPKLYNGRNKTFFEVGFEISHFEEASANNYLEPTLAQLGESTWGAAPTARYMDFSSAQTAAKGSCSATATQASTAACQLYDPTVANFASTPSRPAYIGNQIPISELNPGALAFIHQVFTTPPTTISGFPTTTYNGQVNTPQTQQTYNYSGRIDQHIGEKDFIFFRYSGMQYYDDAPGTIPNLSNLNQNPAQQYGVSWQHVFNPKTSMQIQYDKAHVENDQDETFTVNSPNSVWQTYGCSTDMCDDFVARAALLPTITITGGFSGGEDISPTSNISSIHEWSGTVSRVLGRHQLQAGGGWDEDNYTAIMQSGALTFTGASTGNFPGNPGSAPSLTSSQVSAQSGFGLADFLIDYPNSVNKRNVDLTERPGGVGNIFVQDSWKVSRALTVNYGVRYDRTVIPPYGKENTVGQNGSIETGDFDFTDGQYIVQQLPALCSVQGHAPCLPSSTLPAHVVVAIGHKILHGTKTNVGPHAGFAYRINNSLSVRAGFGIFYDNWAAITEMTQNYQGSWPDTGTLQISSTNTPVAGGTYISAQNPFAANGGNLPAANPFVSSNAGNYYVSPYWKNPYSEEYNLGIDQAIGHKSVLSLNYVGSESHRMDVGGFYNTGTPCGSPCPFASFAARQAANVTGQPYPYAFPVKSWDHSGASSSYNSLQVTMRGHYGSGLSYMVAYTWSKALDEGGDGYLGVEGGVPEDPYNPKGSRGPAGFDIPQSLAIHSEYAIPVGKGQRFSTGNKMADYVLGNWQVNEILIGRTGQPFNVLSGGDIAETGNGNASYERANLVGNPYQSGPIAANPTCTPPAGNTRTRYQWFNPCAFETPSPGTLGDAPRNFLRAQNFWNLDASVFRIVPIKESVQMRLSVEGFNVLNHPVFNSPGAVTTTPSTFGQVTSVQSGNLNRILQFSARFQF